MSLDSDILSKLHDKIIDSELGVLHATSRVTRLERKIDAALAYLDTLTGPFADKERIRDLLRH